MAKALEYLYKDDLFSKPFTARKFYYLSSLLLCEFLGTLFLMFVGCATFIDVGLTGPVESINSYFFIAVSWGTTYGALLVMVNPVSGCLLNPALVPVMVIIGEFSLWRMILYWLVEFIGAIVGLFILLDLMPNVSKGVCLAKPSFGYSKSLTMVYEAWTTFALAILLCGIYDIRTRDNFDFAPVKFGISIFALVLAVYKATGCSMNPARSVATSLSAGNFDNLLVYLIGEFAGAIIGAIFYRLLFSSSQNSKETVAEE